MQPIFQDPFASLNPRMTVGDIIGEPLVVHKLAKGAKYREEVNNLLSMVGLEPRMADRYPHEFSGGQRQRIGIARALAARPSFIVCDEAVSALDVSIQAQIVKLFLELQRSLGLTIVMISHDLAVVRQMCTVATVMYLGKVVETGATESLFNRPAHPYTQALISAVPSPDPRVEAERRRIVLEGDPPSPMKPPPGCRFNTRCAHAEGLCRTSEPALVGKSTGTRAACHMVD